MSLLKNKKLINFTIFIAIIIALKCNSAFAQGINIDFGGEDDQTFFSSKVIQLIGLITILSVAPSILIMVTSFTKITIVFSILRHALGLQQTPPNIVIISFEIE